MYVCYPTTTTKTPRYWLLTIKWWLTHTTTHPHLFNVLNEVRLFLLNSLSATHSKQLT